MRVVIQRSKKSSVSINNKLINKIDKGLVLLVGIHEDDTEKDIDYLVKKIINLRIFSDESGLMNKSILNIKGSILSISQFTLYANTKNGNRPSFKEAKNSSDAKVLYDKFNNELKKYIPVYEGVFGSDMKVTITNDGPVTIIIDSKNI